MKERGLEATVDETFAPGKADYSVLISRIQKAGVEVLFLGGYHIEAGLIFRQARDRDYALRLIATSSMCIRRFPVDRRT
jgi:branched-chain amino acid transport system substrate-binding protein